MSVSSNSFYVKAVTDLIGFGVTLNNDGSVASVLGATIEYVTAAPTATRNAGSIALRSDGTLYITTGGGTWTAVGGGGTTGWSLADNTAGTWGTTSPDQVTSTYVSATKGLDIASPAISQATAAAGSRIRLVTGAVTITGAVAGSNSGLISLLTGATDCTNAGGTGGNSGAISLLTGAATSTAGTSGSSGVLSAQTGNSDDGASGAINIISGNGATASGTITLRTGTASAGGSGKVILQTGTASGLQGQVQFIAATVESSGRITTTDGVTAGTARVVGGLASSTTADSAAVVGNGAAQSFNQTYIIPANTLNAGSTVRIRGCVRRTGINGADTAQVGVRIGGTVYVISAAVAAGAGDRCFFECYATSRAAAGAAVAVVGAGTAGWSTAANFMTASGASANLATNGTLTVDVQVTMPNNAGNTAVLEQLMVDVF
jgi:hypothetical protein